jgi:glycosyltransferase involved in cell wall biosynthesis
VSVKPIKNILYVENGIGYGGAVICLRHLVRNLDRSRFYPLVITGRNSPQYQEIKQEADWQHIPDRLIDVVGMRRKLNQSVGWRHIYGLKWLLNQLLARADDLFNFLPFFLHLLWVAWRFKADLIHANNEPLCNRAALLVGKILHIPTICHVRGEQDGSRLMNWAFTLPDHFISISHWIAKSIQEKMQVPPEKNSIIYDGIALEKLDLKADGAEFRKQYKIPEDAFAVGLVGLLIPWKGQELFLDTAKLLKDTIPKLKMVIIGGTPDDYAPYETMLRQRVIQERLDDIVIFTGHVSKMEPVYNGLNIAISASINPEPLGIVIIEGMAMGRPMIGPNHGGTAEIMEHNRTGLLFTPNNPASLASEIKNLYADNELQLQLGHNARLHVMEKFAMSAFIDEIQSLYDSFLQ